MSFCLSNKSISLLRLIVIALPLLSSCTSDPAMDTSKGILVLDKTRVNFNDTNIFELNKDTQTVTLENVGRTDLLFDIDQSAVAQSPFAYSNDCTGLLAPAETCTLTFQFSPIDNLTHELPLTITNLENNQISKINLIGKGVGTNYISATLPEIIFPSNSITFPNTLLHMSSATKRYIIQNSSAVDQKLTFALTDTNIKNVDDIANVFQIRSTCINAGVLKAHTSCDINILFHPTRLNKVTADLEIIGDGNRKEIVKLSGTGQQNFEVIQTSIKGVDINVREVNFSSTNIDKFEHSYDLIFSNSLDSKIDILFSGITTGDLNTTTEPFYIIDNATTCKMTYDNIKVITLLSNNYCTLAIGFKPKHTKSYATDFIISYFNSKFVIPIKGIGRSITRTIDFGYRDPKGTSITADNIIFANNTSYKINLSKIEVTSTPPDIFTYDQTRSDCTATDILPNTECFIRIIFDNTKVPAIPQAFKGDVKLYDTNNNIIETIPVTVTTLMADNITTFISGSVKYTPRQIADNSVTISDITDKSVASIGQLVYFFGGKFDNKSKDLLSVYDYATDTFTTLQPSGKNIIQDIPQLISGKITNATFIEYKGKIIQYGGVIINDKDEFKNNNNVYIYDPNDRSSSGDGSWKILNKPEDKKMPMMPTASATTIANDRLYVIEGADFRGNMFNLNSERYYIFDLKKLQWSAIDKKINKLKYDNNPMRAFASLFQYKNTLLIYGGAFNGTTKKPGDNSTDNVTKQNITNAKHYINNFAKIDLNNKTEEYPEGTYTDAVDSSDIVTGDVTSVCRTNDASVPVFGPCRPRNLKFININDRLFTLSGPNDDPANNGLGISGPWEYIPDDKKAIAGSWKIIYGNDETETRGPAKLTKINNSLLLFEKDSVEVIFLP